MKHPLIPVALAYLAGLLLAVIWSPGLAWLFGLAVLLLAISLFDAQRSTWLLWPLLAACGWINLTLTMAVLSPVDLRTVVGQRVELVSLRGRLDSTPSTRIRLKHDEEIWHTLAVVQAEAIKRGQEWERASGLVLITTPGTLGPRFFGGRSIEVSGVIEPPPGPVAQGLFDYRNYLKWQGVYHRLRVESTNDWQSLSPHGNPSSPPLPDRFLTWAQFCLTRDLPQEDEPLRLLWAMTLGWKAALTDEVSEPFMRTGTMHIFAISGLHIALIAGILVSLLRVLQLPRTLCGFVVLPIIWFYTAATGWQASAIRSTIMMSVIILGWMLKRPGNLLNSLTASALIILIWDPRQLFQASFQLSFFVVLSIALLLPPLQQKLDAWLAVDPMLPLSLVPRWRRWLSFPARALGLSLATSIAAWLGSLPIIAWYFHLVTPISLVVNMVVIPLGELALACNLGALSCGDWLPLFTEWFNYSAWFWMDLMLRVCVWTAEWPGAWLPVRSPTAIEFLAYYALLLGVFSGWLFASSARPWRIGCAALLLLLPLPQWLASRQQTRITLLAVQAGAAVFVDLPGSDSDLLLDCASAVDAHQVIKPFLQAQAVRHLPALGFTECDENHLGGMPIISEGFRPSLIATVDAQSRSPAYRRLAARLELEPDRWVRLHSGDRLAGWSVLHPPPGTKLRRADDNALVLRAEFGGVRLLCLSGLGRGGQAVLAETGTNLKADIVVAGMPTRDEPLGAALLDAIQPRLVIIHDATFPAFARATDALRSRLGEAKIPVLYTSDSASLTIYLTGHRRWEIQNAEGQTVSRGSTQEVRGNSSGPGPARRPYNTPGPS